MKKNIAAIISAIAVVSAALITGLFGLYGENASSTNVTGSGNAVITNSSSSGDFNINITNSLPSEEQQGSDHD